MSRRDLLAARIVILAFAVSLVAAIAAPLQAAAVTKSSEGLRLRAEPPFSVALAQETEPEETIRVPIWIPGFDDDQPIFVCSLKSTLNLSVRKVSSRAGFRLQIDEKPAFGRPTNVDTCSGMLLMLPWISRPAPIERVKFSIPII